MLEIKNVWKTFNKGTVNENRHSAELISPSMTAIFCTVIGGNGAGKSTTLNAIAGVWPVDCGQILIDGKDISALPEHKKSAVPRQSISGPDDRHGSRYGNYRKPRNCRKTRQKRGLSWGVKADERFRYRRCLQSSTSDLRTECPQK